MRNNKKIPLLSVSKMLPWGRNFGGKKIWRKQNLAELAGRKFGGCKKMLNFGENLIWRMAENIFWGVLNLAHKHKIEYEKRFFTQK